MATAWALPFVAIATLAANHLGAAQGSAESSPSQGGEISAPTEVVEVLRSGLTPWPDGRHHANLMSLRMLADPSLAPLFEALRQSRDWTTRVDAVLGLAELSADRSIDASHVAALPDINDRVAAINSAVGLDLVSPRVAAELLSLPDVPAIERLVLLALARDAIDPATDTSWVNEFAGNESLSLDGMASLTQVGAGNTTAWRAFVDRIAPLSPEQREAVASELSQAAVAYKIPEVGPLLGTLPREAGLSVSGERTIVAARLALKDPGALEHWRSLMQRSTSRRDQLRTALALLAEGPDAGALAPGDPFPAGDSLMDALREAVLVRPDRAARVAWVEALVQLGNVPCTQAALVMAERLPPGEATPIWLAVISASQGEHSTPALANLALVSAAEIAKVEPSALVALCQERPGVFTESCLFALLRAGTPEAADAASTLRGSLGRKADALVLLALAAANRPLTAADDQALIRAASGGADLDAVLQVQAAWLVAKRAGALEAVISSISSSAPPAPATDPAPAP